MGILGNITVPMTVRFCKEQVKCSKQHVANSGSYEYAKNYINVNHVIPL